MCEYINANDFPAILWSRLVVEIRIYLRQPPLLEIQGQG